MKFILLALVMSGSVNANTVVLNSAEAPANRIVNAFKSLLLPTTALLNKQMLELTRDGIVEKMQKFWEKMRGIYKNTSPGEETRSGNQPSRGISPADQIPPAVVSGSFAVNIQTIHNEDGSVYMGHVRNGQPWGQGTMQYPDGTSYRGGWRDGLKDGMGTTFFPPHRLVISQNGHWRDDELMETISIEYKPGVRRLPQGLYYGQLNSSGQPDTDNEVGEEIPAILESLLGLQYVGEFANGVRFGQGRQEYTNGSVYTGEWAYGERHGSGLLSYPDGRTTRAVWRDGELDDQEALPIIRYPNGQIYRGQINQDHQLHGLGTMVFPDGSWVDARWDSGGAEEGFATLHYPDGTSYMGPTIGYYPHGIGTVQEHDLLFDREYDMGSYQLGEEQPLMDVPQHSDSGSATPYLMSNDDSFENPCETSFESTGSAIGQSGPSDNSR